ncbi:hypothetical protein HEK616_10380 [Streptomyces nigrescens]|uniref:Uncharacterized protein n=1 Tax=Streptomyces nigrescens TaxID=1920 RepID=A0ABM7ZMM7_STRNI|nr:hypothetical protein [Streptomyces nigrescens]BDM67551.1 hypothetical protein HEK616_10380 [Streptomyces nigrescens]
MTHYSPGVLELAKQIGLDPHHVAEALRLAHRSFNHIQATTGMTVEQFRRLFTHNRHSIAIVANLAMRRAGRSEDALLLMDIYKASVGTTPYLARTHTGIGALPEHHDHPHVQEAVRILIAAGLPPLHTDGVHELRPGFQVLPDDSGDLPGFVFIAPDPAAKGRTGFAGGDLGYLAVMRWAGWGVITERLPGGLYAACHPDHQHNPFPANPAH